MKQEDIKFMERVYRNWGYYSEKAHKIAEEIKGRIKE